MNGINRMKQVHPVNPVSLFRRGEDGMNEINRMVETCQGVALLPTAYNVNPRAGGPLSGTCPRRHGSVQWRCPDRANLLGK